MFEAGHRAGELWSVSVPARLREGGMARRRSKSPPAVYLPGATWQDVLAGKPVTQEEAQAANRRGGKSPSRCRSCKAIGMAKQGKLTPCCRKCGGVMVRIR